MCSYLRHFMMRHIKWLLNCSMLDSNTIDMHIRDRDTQPYGLILDLICDFSFYIVAYHRIKSQSSWWWRTLKHTHTKHNNKDTINKQQHNRAQWNSILHSMYWWFVIPTITKSIIVAIEQFIIGGAQSTYNTKLIWVGYFGEKERTNAVWPGNSITRLPKARAVHEVGEEGGWAALSSFLCCGIRIS